MTFSLDVEGRLYRVELAPELLAESTGEATAWPGQMAPSGCPRCTVDGTELPIDIRFIQPGVLSLIVMSPEGRRHQFHCVLDGGSVLIDGHRFDVAVTDPRSLQARAGATVAAGGAKTLKAPMPGRVVRLLAEVGDIVTEGQGLLVIEAMKMQNELRSPKAGRLSQLNVQVGDSVASGLVLLIIE